MGAVVKTVLAVAVAVIPGALVALIAFVVARAVMHSFRQAGAGKGAPPVHLREVLASLRFSDLVREARGVMAL
jgi:hypothetical protein